MSHFSIHYKCVCVSDSATLWRGVKWGQEMSPPLVFLIAAFALQQVIYIKRRILHYVSPPFPVRVILSLPSCDSIDRGRERAKVKVKVCKRSGNKKDALMTERERERERERTRLMGHPSTHLTNFVSVCVCVCVCDSSSFLIKCEMR